MEFELIRRIKRKIGGTSSAVIRGIGDDCAVVPGRPGMFNLLTTDAVVEGRHFYRPFFKPFEIGLKAMATAVSDIAAMGGRPLHVLISLGIPQKGAACFVDGFYDGVRAACKKWKVDVIGGNLTSSKVLWVSMTAIGHVRKRNCKYREGARVGDGIYVTGPLGSAALGLFLHRLGRKVPSVFSRAQKTPTPRLRAGEFLGKTPGVTSMIDLSDGLLADLSHILRASRVGAVVEWDKIPRHPQLESLAKKNRFSVHDLVLSRGEDYELLFTVRPHSEKSLMSPPKNSGFKFSRIGEITRRAGLRIIRENGIEIRTTQGGFDHFGGAH